MTGKALHEIEEIFAANMSPFTYQMGVLGLCDLPIQTTEIIGKIGEVYLDDTVFGKMIVSGQISSVIVQPGRVTLLFAWPISLRPDGFALYGVTRTAFNNEIGPWVLVLSYPGHDNDDDSPVRSFCLR